ncbi:MAG TPA: transglycosylase family protein [Xanthomonadales bacterium]|nr:transglycosylase family protein [Xanthomonadales bacterium]
MITTLIAGLMASSVLTTSLPATPNPTRHYSFSQVLEQSDYSNYIVQEGDYLSLIAEAYYGAEDYWTNIWNDNPELKDAAQLEANMVLKIRSTKTVLPEALSPELEERIAAVNPIYTDNEAGASAAVVTPVAVKVATPAPSLAQQPVGAQGTANAPQILNDAQINYLGSCEAGMDPAKNTGNGYYGAFQFSAGTWNSMGTGYARADLAPLDVQKAAVQRLVARSSIFTQFPGCAKKMRSIGLI